MTEKAILFDSSRCTGCRGCQVACKCWNNLPSSLDCAESIDWSGSYTNPPDLNDTTRLIMTFSDFEDENSQKRVGWAITRRACQHCTDAPCAHICPAGALYKDPDTGFVTYDQSKCIGCQYCSSVCPFDVPRYDNSNGTPDPQINKCTGCVDRVANGMAPACVTTCQPEALLFGDRDEMIEQAHVQLDRLHERGYDDACIYGETEMGGLHVIQVLKHGLEAHGQVQNPTAGVVPAIHSIAKPVTGVLAGAVFVALAGMTALSAGSEKHDQVVYNPETGDTLDMETGEVIKHGDGQGTKTWKQYMSQVPVFKKWGEDKDE